VRRKLDKTWSSESKVRSLVPRDSFLGERIVWQGQPEVTAPPAFLRALAAVCFVTAVISGCFGAVIAVALAEFPLASVLFSLWCSGLGVALLVLPRRFAKTARYFVTDRRVIVKYGPFSRSIERRAISFARIFWTDEAAHTGDLEVVRAVPAGALRRRLRLRLAGLIAPDRVWAIIRGAEDVAPAGQGERPVGQRLDHGESVIWTARPRPELKRFIPQGRREWALLALSAFLLAGVGRIVRRALPVLARLSDDTGPARTWAIVGLALGLGLALCLMVVIAAYLVYDAVIRQGILAGDTRYLVTNKRVLIQRRTEELHLDREKIIDVVDAPAGHGLRNVFLVLDGPRARAVAVSGAFGEMTRGPHLRPVFEAVTDAESVSRILRDRLGLKAAA
ncbi:MAG TPA: PH domain-containing protein, partial [Polyangiaceae bacterium]|nr:PH domain-containing protein [Polyangiaceae bacterium]